MGNRNSSRFPHGGYSERRVLLINQLATNTVEIYLQMGEGSMHYQRVLYMYICVVALRSIRRSYAHLL